MGTKTIQHDGSNPSQQQHIPLVCSFINQLQDFAMNSVDTIIIIMFMLIIERQTRRRWDIDDVENYIWFASICFNLTLKKGWKKVLIEDIVGKTSVDCEVDKKIAATLYRKSIFEFYIKNFVKIFYNKLCSISLYVYLNDNVLTFI